MGNLIYKHIVGVMCDELDYDTVKDDYCAPFSLVEYGDGRILAIYNNYDDGIVIGADYFERGNSIFFKEFAINLKDIIERWEE